MKRALALLFMLWAAPLAAQNSPAEAAKAAAEQLAAAADLLAAAEGGRDRVAALTATVQAYEAGLVALRDGLRRAAIRRHALEAELAAKSDEVAQLLGVLETMGRAPAPLLLLHPLGPTGTARSGMLLADVTPALQARAEALKAQLDELAILQALQEDAAGRLALGLDGAQEARTALSTAIQDRTDLPMSFIEDPVQTALLIASAETLDAFASSLGALPFGQDCAPSATATGSLALPVFGTVLRKFGEPDAAGVSRPGIVIATRSRALVTTPIAATLRFQGPLLTYGSVVILEPAAGVLFVLAGLAETFGETGEILPVGAPVGLMGGESPAIDAILRETDQGSGAQANETLYLEVREGQGPVNPAIWFAYE